MDEGHESYPPAKRRRACVLPCESEYASVSDYVAALGESTRAVGLAPLVYAMTALPYMVSGTCSATGEDLVALLDARIEKAQPHLRAAIRAAMCTLIRTAHEADAGGAFTKPQDVFSLSITVGRPQDYPKLRAAIRFVLGEGENTFEYTINY